MKTVGFGDFLIHFSPLDYERMIQSDLMRILGYKQEEKRKYQKSFIKFDNIFGKNE